MTIFNSRSESSTIFNLVEIVRAGLRVTLDKTVQVREVVTLGVATFSKNNNSAVIITALVASKVVKKKEKNHIQPSSLLKYLRSQFHFGPKSFCQTHVGSSL